MVMCVACIGLYQMQYWNLLQLHRSDFLHRPGIHTKYLTFLFSYNIYFIRYKAHVIGEMTEKLHNEHPVLVCILGLVYYENIDISAYKILYGKCRFITVVCQSQYEWSNVAVNYYHFREA